MNVNITVDDDAGAPGLVVAVTVTITSSVAGLLYYSDGLGGAPVTVGFSGDLVYTDTATYPAAGTYVIAATINGSGGAFDQDVQYITITVPAALPQLGSEGTDTKATGTHTPTFQDVPFPTLVDTPGDWGPLPEGVNPTPQPQRALVIDREPYGIHQGVAYDLPMLGANSQSIAFVNDWSSTAHLGNELDLGLMNATARWLPIVTDVHDRTDIGSDVTEWQPHFGSAAGWMMHGVSAPYIDEDYDYYASGARKKTCHAYIFDGDHWMQSLLGTGHTEFAFIIVATLRHPRQSVWQDILSSPSSATDPRKAVDATLRYYDGRVQTYINGKLSETRLHPPIHRGRKRPSILVWSEDANGGTFGVISAHGRHFHDYKKPVHGSFDLRMFLGNNGGAPTADNAAEMDVLDILYYDHRIHRKNARHPVSRLNHAYGVSGH